MSYKSLMVKKLFNVQKKLMSKNIKSEETIGELLDMMVGDVLKLFPNIPKLD